MVTPDDVLRDSTARTLAALIRVYARDGRATVRSVADESGLKSSVTHKNLHRLEALDLVRGVSIQGGLRPAVAPAPIR